MLPHVHFLQFCEVKLILRLRPHAAAEGPLYFDLVNFLTKQKMPDRKTLPSILNVAAGYQKITKDNLPQIRTMSR